MSEQHTGSFSIAIGPNVPRLWTHACTTPMSMLGRIQWNVYHRNQQHRLQEIVVPVLGTNRLGVGWAAVLNKSAYHIYIDDFLKPYESVFGGGVCSMQVLNKN